MNGIVDNRIKNNWNPVIIVKGNSYCQNHSQLTAHMEANLLTIVFYRFHACKLTSIYLSFYIDHHLASISSSIHLHHHHLYSLSPICNLSLSVCHLSIYLSYIHLFVHLHFTIMMNSNSKKIMSLRKDFSSQSKKGNTNILYQSMWLSGVKPWW